MIMLGRRVRWCELGVLMARARELLEPAGQGSFDLGVEASVLVSPLVADPCEVALLPQVAPMAVRSSPGQVVATGSGVLYDALAGAWTIWGSLR